MLSTNTKTTASFALSAALLALAMMLEQMLRWLPSAPLGLPVVPLV